MLSDIKQAIDNRDMQGLYQLALLDPLSFFGKLSVRQIGKLRIEKLQAMLEVMTNDQINKDKFAQLMLARIANDLGKGMFKK